MQSIADMNLSNHLTYKVKVDNDDHDSEKMVCLSHDRLQRAKSTQKSDDGGTNNCHCSKRHHEVYFAEQQDILHEKLSCVYH